MSTRLSRVQNGTRGGCERGAGEEREENGEKRKEEMKKKKGEGTYVGRPW